MEHEDENCECYACKNGFDALAKKEQELIEKFGWYTHMVAHNDWCDTHTHHVSESYNHPDLQITLPLSQSTVSGILNVLVTMIKSGTVFKEGLNYEGIIRGYEVTFIKVSDGIRDLLRIILPDRDGNLIEEDMDPVYAAQYENR